VSGRAQVIDGFPAAVEARPGGVMVDYPCLGRPVPVTYDRGGATFWPSWEALGAFLAGTTVAEYMRREARRCRARADEWDRRADDEDARAAKEGGGDGDE
jgi:hypothetical protein